MTSSPICLIDPEERILPSTLPRNTTCFEHSSPFMSRTSSTIPSTCISAIFCSTHVPLRIFALHVRRVYPRSRTEGPKIETRIESGFNFLRKAQQSPHQLMDLKRERIKHPNGPAASRFCTRSPGQRYNK